MNRLSVTLAAALFLFLSIIIVQTRDSYAADANLKAVGKVTSVSGKADIVKNSGAEASVPLRKGMLVYEKDMIRTAKGAKAEVTFNDGSVINVAPESKIEISQYVFGADNTTRKKGVVKVYRGKMRSIVSTSKGLLSLAKLSSGENTFETRTPVAIAGVKGTDYVTSVGLDGTAFFVNDGTVEVTNPNFPDDVVVLGKGKVTYVKSSNKPPTKARDANDKENASFNKGTDDGEDDGEDDGKDDGEGDNTFSENGGDGEGDGGEGGGGEGDGGDNNNKDMFENGDFVYFQDIPPKIDYISLPAVFSNLPDTTITFTVTETSTVTYTLDGGGEVDLGSGMDFSIPLTTLTETVHTITVTAVDLGKNKTISTYSWINDYTPPTLNVTTATPNLTNQRTATFDMTNSVDATPVTFYFSLDGWITSVTTTSSVYTLPIPIEGLNTVSVYAVDAAGNASTVAAPEYTFSWTTDYTAPVAAGGVSNPLSNGRVTSTSGFAFDLVSVSEPVTYDAITTTGNAGAFTGPTFNYTPTVEGYQDLQLVITDLAGNSTTYPVSDWFYGSDSRILGGQFFGTGELAGVSGTASGELVLVSTGGIGNYVLDTLGAYAGMPMGGSWSVYSGGTGTTVAGVDGYWLSNVLGSTASSYYPGTTQFKYLSANEYVTGGGYYYGNADGTNLTGFEYSYSPALTSTPLAVSGTIDTPGAFNSWDYLNATMVFSGSITGYAGSTADIFSSTGGQLVYIGEFSNPANAFTWAGDTYVTNLVDGSVFSGAIFGVSTASGAHKEMFGGIYIKPDATSPTGYTAGYMLTKPAGVTANFYSQAGGIFDTYGMYDFSVAVTPVDMGPTAVLPAQLPNVWVSEGGAGTIVGTNGLIGTHNVYFDHISDQNWGMQDLGMGGFYDNTAVMPQNWSAFGGTAVLDGVGATIGYSLFGVNGTSWGGGMFTGTMTSTTLTSSTLATLTDSAVIGVYDQAGPGTWEGSGYGPYTSTPLVVSGTIDTPGAFNSWDYYTATMGFSGNMIGYVGSTADIFSSTGGQLVSIGEFSNPANAFTWAGDTYVTNLNDGSVFSGAIFGVSTASGAHKEMFGGIYIKPDATSPTGYTAGYMLTKPADVTANFYSQAGGIFDTYGMYDFSVAVTPVDMGSTQVLPAQLPNVWVSEGGFGTIGGTNGFIGTHNVYFDHISDQNWGMADIGMGGFYDNTLVMSQNWSAYGNATMFDPVIGPTGYTLTTLNGSSWLNGILTGTMTSTTLTYNTLSGFMDYAVIGVYDQAGPGTWEGSGYGVYTSVPLTASTMAAGIVSFETSRSVYGGYYYAQNPEYDYYYAVNTDPWIVSMYGYVAYKQLCLWGCEGPVLERTYYYADGTTATHTTDPGTGITTTVYGTWDSNTFNPADLAIAPLVLGETAYFAYGGELVSPAWDNYWLDYIVGTPDSLWSGTANMTYLGSVSAAPGQPLRATFIDTWFVSNDPALMTETTLDGGAYNGVLMVSVVDGVAKGIGVALYVDNMANGTTYEAGYLNIGLSGGYYPDVTMISMTGASTPTMMNPDTTVLPAGLGVSLWNETFNVWSIVGTFGSGGDIYANSNAFGGGSARLPWENWGIFGAGLTASIDSANGPFTAEMAGSGTFNDVYGGSGIYMATVNGTATADGFITGTVNGTFMTSDAIGTITGNLLLGKEDYNLSATGGVVGTWEATQPLTFGDTFSTTNHYAYRDTGGSYYYPNANQSYVYSVNTDPNSISTLGYVARTSIEGCWWGCESWGPLEETLYRADGTTWTDYYDPNSGFIIGSSTGTWDPATFDLANFATPPDLGTGDVPQFDGSYDSTFESWNTASTSIMFGSPDSLWDTAIAANLTYMGSLNYWMAPMDSPRFSFIGDIVSTSAGGMLNTTNDGGSYAGYFGYATVDGIAAGHGIAVYVDNCPGGVCNAGYLTLTSDGQYHSSTGMVSMTGTSTATEMAPAIGDAVAVTGVLPGDLYLTWLGMDAWNFTMNMAAKSVSGPASFGTADTGAGATMWISGQDWGIFKGDVALTWPNGLMNGSFTSSASGTGLFGDYPNLAFGGTSTDYGVYIALTGDVAVVNGMGTGSLAGEFMTYTHLGTITGDVLVGVGDYGLSAAGSVVGVWERTTPLAYSATVGFEGASTFNVSNGESGTYFYDGGSQYSYAINDAANLSTVASATVRNLDGSFVRTNYYRDGTTMVISYNSFGWPIDSVPGAAWDPAVFSIWDLKNPITIAGETVVEFAMASSNTGFNNYMNMTAIIGGVDSLWGVTPGDMRVMGQLTPMGFAPDNFALLESTQSWNPYWSDSTTLDGIGAFSGYLGGASANGVIKGGVVALYMDMTLGSVGVLRSGLSGTYYPELTSFDMTGATALQQMGFVEVMDATWLSANTLSSFAGWLGMGADIGTGFMAGGTVNPGDMRTSWIDGQDWGIFGAKVVGGVYKASGGSWTADFGGDAVFGSQMMRDNYGYYSAHVATGVSNGGVLTGQALGDIMTYLYLGTLDADMYFALNDIGTGYEGSVLGMWEKTTPLSHSSEITMSEIGCTSCIGYEAMFGGINTEALWDGLEHSVTSLGSYYGGGALYPNRVLYSRGDWTSHLTSYNVFDGTNTTNDGGAYRLMFAGLDLNGSVGLFGKGIYIDPTGTKVGILTTVNDLTGTAVYTYDIDGTLSLNGTMQAVEIATITGVTPDMFNGFPLYVYNNSMSLSGSGSFVAGGAISVDNMSSYMESFDILGSNSVSPWGIWGAVINGSYTGAKSSDLTLNLAVADATVLVEGTSLDGGVTFAGTARGYWSEPMGSTGIIIGEVKGVADAGFVGAIEAVAVGVHFDTPQYLAMVASGQTALTALNVPFAEIGVDTLSGTNANLAMTLANVKFFAYQSGDKPLIWATSGVSGTYDVAPSISEAVNLTGAYTSATFTVKTWEDFDNGGWSGSITNGTGALTAGSYTAPITFEGAAAGTVTTGSTPTPTPGAFIGTAAGIVQ